MAIAELSNFCGFEYGQIEIPEVDATSARIVLVMGYNYSGKSSLLKGIARAASQMRYKNKQEAQEDLRLTAASGYVRLKKGNKETSVSVPDGDIIGESITASTVAVGLESIADLKSKVERFNLLSKALQSVPQYEDLETEILKAGYTEVDAQNAWKMICPPATKVIDWEGANKDYNKLRTKLTGRWCEVTKARQYGKADEWVPDGFTRDELQVIEPEALEKEIEKAKERLEKSTAGKALSSHQREQLQQLVDQIPSVEESIEKCKKEGAALKKEKAQFDDVVSDFIKCACFKCGTEQVIIDGASIDPESVTLDPEAKKKVAEINQKLFDATSLYKRLSEILKKATQAKEDLDGSETATEEDETELQEAKNLVSLLESKKAAYARFTRANDLHQDIQKVDLLKKLTAADGLPGKMLRKPLREFNELLKEICEIGNWSEVQVSEGDASVMQNGMAFHRRSDSEQLRAKIAIQLAFARFDGSELVVIDELELLDERDGGLPGLIYVLDECGIPAVVACMANSEKHAKAISETSEDGYSYGKRYWAENGQIRLLDQVEVTT